MTKEQAAKGYELLVNIDICKQDIEKIDKAILCSMNGSWATLRIVGDADCPKINVWNDILPYVLNQAKESAKARLTDWERQLSEL